MTPARPREGRSNAVSGGKGRVGSGKDALSESPSSCSQRKADAGGCGLGQRCNKSASGQIRQGPRRWPRVLVPVVTPLDPLVLPAAVLDGLTGVQVHTP